MIVDHEKQRRAARYPVRLPGLATFSAELATLDPARVFAVDIRNVSRGGLAITLSQDAVLRHDLDYRRVLRVRFVTEEGENKVVAARVVWFRPEDGLVAVGLELLDEAIHDEFHAWVERLGGARC